MLTHALPLGRKKTEYSRILLIVDDCAEVATTAKRCLASWFDKIITTTSPDVATRILQGNTISHVLCDLNLGTSEIDQLCGFVYAEQWRAAFLDLERIVIFTASDISDIKIPFAVDGIVSKSHGMDCIANALLLPEELEDGALKDVDSVGT